MQCVRCGAIFEGRFCPRCGAPAMAAAPTAATGWPCPRCGTLYRGNFCPRCGLPTAAWAYQSPASPSGGRSVLSVLWTLAMVGFIVFAITDFAGLVWSPALIVPGVQGIASGQTVNSALDFQGNWTNDSWGTGSTLSYQSAGGNLGGYLEMTLFSSGARGFWMQAFRVEGSQPFEAAVRLDVKITGGLDSGQLLVSVDSSPSVPDDPATAIVRLNYTGPIPWTPTGRLDASAKIDNRTTYYLKVAFVASNVSSPVSVGFDNIRLAWTTDAFVYLYLPVPLPVVFFVSQDKTLFLVSEALIISVIFLAGLYYAIRERKLTWTAFSAPLEAVGTRLRSRSAWIAIAQTWMAVTFFQYTVILLILLARYAVSVPINIDATNAWMWLYELAITPIREEFAFRILLIGVPMALGSVVLRVMEVNRGGGPWDGPSSAGKHIAGAWRYLVGGAVRSDSPKETLVAAWALLFASSAIFGLAHGPGWGWWKILPAAVAGLGFGYLFLRHGVGAAILAHFVNDYIGALIYEGIGGAALDILLGLLLIGLVVAGAGFFVWYAIDAWRHFRDLLARFRPPIRPASMPAPGPTYESSTMQPAATPPAPGPSSPPQYTWTKGDAAFPVPAQAVRDPGRIPRDYVPTYVPPPYGYPPVRFQCPYCGWVEARYDTGRFTCTRCSRIA